MSLPVRIPLGAPGIYKLPDSPIHAMTGVRMDVCAFVGVAPRGPARSFDFSGHWFDDQKQIELWFSRQADPTKRTGAHPVESFDEYRRLFGGFEGPGLLPYSVAAFFEQGGRRAYVARIVHDYGDANENADGVAKGEVPGARTRANKALTLRARNEGSWGNGLRAALDFTLRPVQFEPPPAPLKFDEAVNLLEGTLLRLTLKDGTRELRLLEGVETQPRADRPGFVLEAQLDQPVVGEVVAVEVVEGILLIDDGDGRRERHEQFAFSSVHPRWLARMLAYESELVFPEGDWFTKELIPTNADLPATTWSAHFRGTGDKLVADRYSAIKPEDSITQNWLLGDEPSGEGVLALAQLSDVATIVVPDLYSPAPLVATSNVIDPLSLAGPEFDRCVDLPPGPEQTAAEYDLEGLRLDPRDPESREKIIALQSELVDFADSARFVVLLDVPPGLNQRQILSWRARFNSAFAAAYHPWLQVARRDDSRDALVRVPPAAVAAGIIAKQELRFGVPQGPANALAAEVVGLDDVVSSARHDELHPQGINIYLRERDGIRLTAARTLSRDPLLRQLSVRRLLTMICRALEQQMQWVVFEPHNRALRTEVRLALESYLRELFRLGAFRGATEEQAFFVRCDETNNPPFMADAGRLVAEIGVAPAEPLEFIVLRLAREGDGTLTLREK